MFGDPGQETVSQRGTPGAIAGRPKWSADEDSEIVRLRRAGAKWSEISKSLPGRSAISCRLHYRNYLEKPSKLDENEKVKFATLYQKYVERHYTEP
ncbi:uncharacterized protein A1O9_12962 [Exophiala aquamarina CBS 119918]|uniref:Uncharacterized protein n=1 Tax=Exophiala aquamarina CBS 119918 TaxID=1182545 RepID=A0A072P5U1_9EURO|nr:uncharacterized protein A1O9_12962 [Exophiala aquamarina CBS 119918]KEF50985.1 hypothetical protein A1O9_12962 [Exophiala aquamarina CBS 119918]